MTSTQRRYVAWETLISIVINTLISALFMEISFGGSASINLWGARGLALDFVPQTFMISAMSIIVPTLLLRRRRRAGALAAASSPPLPAALQALWKRVLLVSILLTVLAGGLGTGLLAVIFQNPLPFWNAFSFKLAYGAIIAAIATPVGLLMALSEPGLPHRARENSTEPV